VLGPEAMGVWVALQVVLGYFKYSNFGVGTAVEREIPFNKGRGNFERAERIRHVSFTFTGVTSAALGIASIGAACWARPRYGDGAFIAIIVLGALSFLQKTSTMCIATLRAERRFSFINRFNVISSFVNAALTVILIRRFHLNGYYGSMILSYLFNLFYLLYGSDLRFRLVRNWKGFGPIIRLGLVLIAVNACGTFFQSTDKIAIGMYLGVAPLGVYSLSLMANNLLISIPRNLNVVMFPYLSEAYGASQAPSDLRKFIVEPNLLIATYFSAIIALAWALSPWLVSVFLPEYVSGLEALRAGMFISLATVLTAQISYVLITIHKQFWMIPLQLAAGCATIAIGKVIAPSSGIEGVAWMFFAMQIVLASVYAAVALRAIGGSDDSVMHGAQVVGWIVYFIGVTWLTDRLCPSMGAVAAALRVAIVCAAAAPALIYGEKRFCLSVHLKEILQRKTAPQKASTPNA